MQVGSTENAEAPSGQHCEGMDSLMLPPAMRMSHLDPAVITPRAPKARENNFYPE